MKTLKTVLLVLMCVTACLSASVYGHRDAFFNTEFSYKLFEDIDYWQRNISVRGDVDLDTMAAIASAQTGYKGYYYSNGLGKCEYKGKQTVFYAVPRLNAAVFASAAQHNTALNYSEYSEGAEVGVYVGGKAYKKLEIGDRFEITLDNGKVIKAVVADKIADNLVLPGVIKNGAEYDINAQKFGIVMMPDVIGYADAEKGYPVIVYDESITAEERLGVYRAFNINDTGYRLFEVKYMSGAHMLIKDNLWRNGDSEKSYLYALSVAAAVITGLLLFIAFLKQDGGYAAFIIIFGGGALLLAALNVALLLVFNGRYAYFSTAGALVSLAAYLSGAAGAFFTSRKILKNKRLFGDNPDLYKAGKMNCFSLSALLAAALSLIAAFASYRLWTATNYDGYTVVKFYSDLVIAVAISFAVAAAVGAALTIINLKLKIAPEAGRANE